MSCVELLQFVNIRCEANQTLSVSPTKKVSTGHLKPGFTANLLPEGAGGSVY
jgi:hypothetical protein